jgi:hypothetical protein
MKCFWLVAHRDKLAGEILVYSKNGAVCFGKICVFLKE